MSKSKTDPAIWAQVKHDYIMLAKSPSQLSETFKIPEATISKRAEREQWFRQRQQAVRELEDTLLRESAKTRIRELVKFNEDDLKMAKALRARVAKRLHDAETDPDKPITTSELKLLASTSDIAQKMGRLALGATTTNPGLPDPDTGAGTTGPIKNGDIAGSIVDVPIDQLPEEERNAIIDKYLGSLVQVAG